MTNKLIIDNVAFSIQKTGGISVVWYEIIKRLLQDSRYDLSFIEFESAGQNMFRQLLPIPASIISVRPEYLYKVERYLNPKPGIKQPYIFHSTYYRTSRDSQAINVTTVHDFNYERSGDKDLRTRVHIWQQKQAVMESDIVICISENTKRELLHFYKGVDESKIHVIYNGVSDEYKKIDGLRQNQLPFAPKTYCMFVGARPAYKNFKLAVEAIAATRFKLVIVGKPLSEEEKELVCERMDMRRVVVCTGVSNERLNTLYNGAFALLYPSSYEGFGIPGLEAQRGGCPVIAFNGSSIPEVVNDKDSLLKDLSVKAVLEKIERLEDANLYKRVSEDGQIFAQRFSWDNTYSQLTTLYDKALAATTGGGQI